ncbi:nucleotidyltransferase domain-containing protein, partial [bacterium]|nr:nucleotidyltransferase domain-containing protein [bacterium]
MPHDLKAENLRELSPQERLVFLKSNLKNWNGKLHNRHLAGEAGLAHAQAHSEAIDHLLRTLLLSLLKEGEELSSLALVASGGYGRGIMNPGSDVDLLFLTSVPSSKVSKRVSEIICE